MSRIRTYHPQEHPLAQQSPFIRRLDFSILRSEIMKHKDLLPSEDLIAAIDALDASEDLSAVEVSYDLLHRHEAILARILSPLFSPLLQTNEIKAAMLPFFPFVFNATVRFIALIDQASGEGDIELKMSLDEGRQYVQACLFILQQIYGANVQQSTSFTARIRDAATGINRHYRVLLNADFMTIELAHERYRLSDDEVSHLLDNVDDEALWKKKIPSGSYVIKGFAIMKLLDMTREKAISLLKSDLLEPNILYDEQLQMQVTRDLGSILQIPDLKIGFLAADHSDELTMHTIGVGIWNSILLHGRSTIQRQDIYSPEFVNDSKKDNSQPIILNEELAKCLHPELIEELKQTGINSYAAVPLLADDTKLGVIELASSQEHVITKIKLTELEDILPLFVTAFRGYLDDYETQIKAIIQDKYTAIHPSVEWRFREEAERQWTLQSIGQKVTDRPIRFDQLYPLYGQTDIRNSSLHRNQAILLDIAEQLLETINLLDAIVTRHEMPFYKMLHQQAKEYHALLKADAAQIGETEFLHFLRSKVYPALEHLLHGDTEVASLIQSYYTQLDQESGLITRNRQVYQHEVNEVNSIISKAIEKGQARAQKMFPHYFKKYKTDGIEHDMYIGQSLAKHRKFDTVFVQNLRLWQLMITCEIERRIFCHQRESGYHLEVCSLILVHSRPISISFRMDEKLFDVEGAYNLRYEIIKKRVDKALVADTGERITQPHKLTIIYTEEDERDSYLGYLNYLKSISYLEGPVEEYDLADLQGVSGLKALRVAITLPESPLIEHLYSEDVVEVV